MRLAQSQLRVLRSRGSGLLCDFLLAKIGTSAIDCTGFRNQYSCGSPAGNDRKRGIMLTARTPFVAAGTRPVTKARCSVVMQARPTKAADFRGLDNVEILQKVSELKRECLRLEYMQRTRGNLINPGAEPNPEAVAPKPHEFAHTRRQIAQLLTILRQREMEAGIDTRDSRRLRKQAKVAAGFGRF